MISSHRRREQSVDMPAAVKKTISLPPDLARAVEQMARSEGKTLSAIVQDALRNDPVWYAGILWQRFDRILTDQTPIRIVVGTLTILAFTYHGALAILVLLGTVRWRRWPETKLLMLSAAPSLTPLLIFSGKGATYYSIYHIVAAAIAIAMTVQYLRARMRDPS